MSLRKGKGRKMTLLALYGMDLYNTKTDLFTEPNWTAVTDTNISIQTNKGRFGAGALRLIGAGGLGDVLQLAVGATPTTLFFGGSIKIANYNHNTDILRFLEGANEHAKLRINNITNNLELWVNGILRSKFDFTLGFWHRIEVKLTINNSTGEIIILIDRNLGTDFATAIQVSSVFTGNTQAGANAYTDTIEFISNPAASLETEILWDDITINDDAGTENNTWLGDIRIQTIRPIGDTAQKDMVPSAGIINFDLIDEASGPDVSDYVTPDNIGDKDLYTNNNVLSGFNNIQAIQVKAFAQAGDVTSTVRLITKSGATEGFSDSQTLNPISQFQNFIFETDPDTSAAWIENNINIMEIGIERDS